jgi:V/A-type H+-transporting ATPase subunit A
MTKGIKIGVEVEFVGDMLAVESGRASWARSTTASRTRCRSSPSRPATPGTGHLPGCFSSTTEWDFTPVAKVGDVVVRGDCIGTVPEGAFVHRVMVPFDRYGSYTVSSVAAAGKYKIRDTVAELTDAKGNKVSVTMSFRWPVKRAVDCYANGSSPWIPWSPACA